MSEPFIAEIRIFAGNFAPRGWAFCDGTLLPIAQHTALFSLIGTTYGGDGQTTTALPDLRGRAPMHPGNGPGLSQRSLGERGGTDDVSLTSQQLPPHSHAAQATADEATSVEPSNHVPARTEEDAYGEKGRAVPMPAAALTSSGGSQPHNNRQPYLALAFIIALLGIYPSRN